MRGVSAEQLSALVSGPIQETNETVMTEKPKARLSGRQAYLDLARKAFIARRRRSQHFKKGMFGEPAWEILLALYIRDTSGGRLTITRLTDMIGLPPTSGLRWLDYLEKEHLVERESHPTDLRAFFVHLTDKGRTSMDLVFFRDTYDGGIDVESFCCRSLCGAAVRGPRRSCSETSKCQQRCPRTRMVGRFRPKRASVVR